MIYEKESKVACGQQNFQLIDWFQPGLGETSENKHLRFG